MDWFRSLRILLRMESKDYVVEEPIDELAFDANEDERNAWEQHVVLNFVEPFTVDSPTAFR